MNAGFSYWTNLVGMTVDTVLAFELVTSNGKFQTVTAKDEELFWALKVCLSTGLLLTSAKVDV